MLQDVARLGHDRHHTCISSCVSCSTVLHENKCLIEFRHSAYGRTVEAHGGGSKCRVEVFCKGCDVRGPVPVNSECKTQNVTLLKCAVVDSGS